MEHITPCAHRVSHRNDQPTRGRDAEQRTILRTAGHVRSKWGHRGARARAGWLSGRPRADFRPPRFVRGENHSARRSRCRRGSHVHMVIASSFHRLLAALLSAGALATTAASAHADDAAPALHHAPISVGGGRRRLVARWDSGRRAAAVGVNRRRLREDLAAERLRPGASGRSFVLGPQRRLAPGPPAVGRRPFHRQQVVPLTEPRPLAPACSPGFAPACGCCCPPPGLAPACGCCCAFRPSAVAGRLRPARRPVSLAVGRRHFLAVSFLRRLAGALLLFSWLLAVLRLLAGLLLAALALARGLVTRRLLARGLLVVTR